MADKNRRGEDDADGRLDNEAVDDAVDDAADTDEPVSRGGGTATRARPKAESADPAKPKARRERAGFFGRVPRFIREVVAELRKVIWPTRKELLTYTAVVVTFVTVVTAIVVLFDFAFAKGALWVFGNPS